MVEVSKTMPHSHRRQREAGYLLLAIMLMMAFLVIAMAYVVGPAMVQQMKRDREEEMIHRGTEYARAIKKFYKKNGRYPASLDDLDKGQIRFLRQRYKDPLTKDGKWKLLQYGDIQGLLNTAAPGTPAAALGAQGASAFTPGGGVTAGPGGALGAQPFGGQQAFPQQQFQTQPNQGQQFPGATSGFSSNSSQGNNPEGVPSPGGFSGVDSSGNPSGSSGAAGQNSSGNGQSGSIFGQGSNGNSPLGGGAIVGVASMSKDPTIRIYNKKKKYEEWQFIYNPQMDQPNVLLRGPYQPTTIGSSNIGTPAGQLNGQQQQNGFGQPNNGFGQPGSSFGQPTNSGYGQPSPQQVPSGQNQLQ